MSMLADWQNWSSSSSGSTPTADTHTAALVAVDTRALLATITVAVDGDGYAQLLELAERHGGLRAWAIEGAGGYGVGLARHLADTGEMVVERLNRCGNRQLNRDLRTIALSRLRYDADTRAYADGRRALPPSRPHFHRARGVNVEHPQRSEDKRR